MGKVKIVTDTTSCIPAEFIQRYDIKVLPTGLIIDDKLYRDCIDISLDELCQLLPKLEKQPNTAAVSPGDFLEMYRELAKTTDSIVCILVSKAQTATHESAYQARRLIRPEYPALNIEIIDSRTSAGALGFVAMEAAKAADQGKSLEEVMQVVRDMVSRVFYLATVDTLKYILGKGRTVKGATNSIGEMLNIKPIIGLIDDTGLTEVVTRVRGKQNAISKIVDLISKYVDSKHPLHVMVHYSDSIKDAKDLRDMITKKYKCSEIYLTPYTPVMVSCTGPMVGVSFYTDSV